MNTQTKITLAKVPNQPEADPSEIFIKVRNFNFYYGSHQTLFDVNLDFQKKQVTSLIGPSGCGKSTLLRCFNRMNDLVPNINFKGSITVNNQDIFHPSVDVIELRRRIGMVFQKSNPFPKSIFENVAYGLRVRGVTDKALIEQTVERSLRGAALWEEVKNDLAKSALALSGGQQQRLCIARAIAISPEVILMDEPCSALDPMATAKIEELIFELKKDYTILIVTHNMQQAARVSDETCFMYLGKVIEFGVTDQIFTNPTNTMTENYITGRFG